MDKETEGENGNHDVHDRERHEFATFHEKTVSGTELACERINDGEEIDGSVKQKEDDEECTTYRLNQFLSD
jgi:hypothetical protein